METFEGLSLATAEKGLFKNTTSKWIYFPYIIMQGSFEEGAGRLSAGRAHFKHQSKLQHPKS